MTCLLACAKKQSPGVVRHSPVPKKEDSFYRDCYEDEHFLSTDKFFIKPHGLLPCGFGR